MRVLIEYTREDRVKYISHLDLMRTMQRAIRRANIPIAWSQGFNPHPVMAFASALAVGVTSEGEYMDIVLSEPMSLPVLKEQLNHALPKGIIVKEAIVTPGKTPSLMSLIQRADYKVTAEGIKSKNLSSMEISWQKALEAYHAAAQILVKKKGKKGIAEVDLKAGVEEIHIDAEDANLLYLTLRVGSPDSLKPESVVYGLLKQSGQLPDPESEGLMGLGVSFHRTGLYLEQNGQWVTPMALKDEWEAVGE